MRKYSSGGTVITSPVRRSKKNPPKVTFRGIRRALRRELTLRRLRQARQFAG